MWQLCGHGMLFPNHGIPRSLAAKFVMNFSAQPLQGNPGIVLGAFDVQSDDQLMLENVMYTSILLSNVGMDQVSGLLNQPNVFGIFWVQKMPAPYIRLSDFLT